MINNWYDAEFYHEPSEFEEQVESFKESLMNAVKEEYKAEMERLREKNKELLVYKSNFENIKTEYLRKERDLERERENMRRELRKERLSSLMEDFKVTMYQVNTEWIKPKKCDKCDENRLIHYKTPLGNDANERCTCNKSKAIYVPVEFICVRLHLDNQENELTVWYNIPTKDDENGLKYSFSSRLDTVYSGGMDFEKLDKYGTFFNTIEECQAYCDWLNAWELSNVQQLPEPIPAKGQQGLWNCQPGGTGDE